MKILKHNIQGFTMVELVVAFALFGIFIVLVGEGFASMVVSLNDTRSRGEEQAIMLYDGFSIDELLGNTKKIYPSNSVAINSGVLFQIDSPLLSYPYLYAGFYQRTKTAGTTENNSYLGLKKIVLLNDFVNLGSKIYYTSPGENMIKEYGSLNTWGTGILNNPTGFTFSGSIAYVSDTGNNCIRTFNGSSISSCVVGKQKVPGFESNLLVSPTYMAMKGNDLYISDTYSHRIRKTSIINTGTIDSVFGNGYASDSITGKTGMNIGLNLPAGLAFSGNFLYVADSGNHRILKLDTITGSGEIFIGNGIAKSTFLGPVNGSTNTSISYPTGLKITGNTLYFSESISGLVKSIDLTTRAIRDEVGNMGNIAYFGDFEVPEIGTSYGLSGGSGQIIGEDIQIPYSGEKLLEITSNSNNVTFNYGFSGSILKRDQSLDFSFSLKSNSGGMIEYGPALNQTFLPGKSKTGSLSDQWTTFQVSYNDSSKINSFSFKISNISPGNIFYLDTLKILNNNINLVSAHKYEANFQNIGGLSVQGTDLYFSDLFAGKNYKASLNTSMIESQTGVLTPINNNFLPNMPDDYQSNAPLSWYSITKIEDSSMQSILGITFDFLGKNASVLQKHISIK